MRLRSSSSITDKQFGLMPDRSITDAIFALRMFTDEEQRRSRAAKQCVYRSENAYDKVPRAELWCRMREAKIPEVYV